MNKNDVFTFTTPNGVEVTGVVINLYDNAYYVQKESKVSADKMILAYAQNRLVLLKDDRLWLNGKYFGNLVQARILVDYCVIPELDEILENYWHQIDMANDYADKTL